MAKKITKKKKVTKKKVTKKIKIEFVDGKLKIDNPTREAQVATVLGTLSELAKTYKGIIENLLENQANVTITYNIEPKRKPLKE